MFELTEEMEDAIYAAHEKQILECYGEDALESANVSWMFDEVNGYVQLKIYCVGVVHTTYFDPDTGCILNKIVSSSK